MHREKIGSSEFSLVITIEMDAYNLILLTKYYFKQFRGPFIFISKGHPGLSFLTVDFNLKNNRSVSIN